MFRKVESHLKKRQSPKSEIPYNVDEVLNTIRKREKQGKKFTIIAMAEGAISDETAGKTKMVNVNNELIRQADSLGISLGRKA